MPERPKDQAAGLRQMFSRPRPASYAIIAGSSGSGATRISCSLAATLSKQGASVTLVDEHHGAHGAAALLDVRFRYDLWQVVNGHVELDRARICANERLHFVSSARLASKGGNLDEAAKTALHRCLRRLAAQGEVLVVDAKADTGGRLSPLAASAGGMAVVSGTHSASVMGSYLTLKAIALTQPTARLGIIVNRPASIEQAISIGANIRDLALRQLGRSIEYFGHVPIQRNWIAQSGVQNEPSLDLTDIMSLLMERNPPWSSPGETLGATSRRCVNTDVARATAFATR